MVLIKDNVTREDVKNISSTIKRVKSINTIILSIIPRIH